MKWVGGLLLTYFILCSSVPPPDLDSWALRADRCDKLSVPVCFFFQLFWCSFIHIEVILISQHSRMGGFGSWCGCSSDVDKNLNYCAGENCNGWKVHWLVWLISLCVEGECPVMLFKAGYIVSCAWLPLRGIKDALCYVGLYEAKTSWCQFYAHNVQGWS